MTTEARAGLLCCLGLATLAGCGDGEPLPEASAPGPGPTGIRYLAAAGDAAEGFARALEPRDFVFPADHAPHPAFRTEWWYFTGNVLDRADRHYGFELTLFRVALTAAAPARESTLASNQVWMGHLAVTDTGRQRFQTAERLSRGAAGLAGVVEPESPEDPAGAISIAVEDWAIRFSDDAISLTAADSGFGIDLELGPTDRIVLQGNAGLDAKGPEPGNASYYYSAPRLAVSGRIRSDGAASVAVEGTAWMDREWSTSALSADLAGWDWFALQLDDGRDLMYYRLRRRDGGTSAFSGGSLVAASGEILRLGADDVELTATRLWTSPATGIRYPTGWRLSLPAHDLSLEVAPRLDDQELDLTVRYWEGAVIVSGRSGDAPVSGIGYLELAGY